jgi:hypothetical protein
MLAQRDLPMTARELAQLGMSYATRYPVGDLDSNAIPDAHGISPLRRYSDGRFGDAENLIQAAQNPQVMTSQRLKLPNLPQGASLDAPPVQYLMQLFAPKTVGVYAAQGTAGFGDIAAFHGANTAFEWAAAPPAPADMTLALDLPAPQGIGPETWAALASSTTQTLVCCVQTDDDLPPRFEHDALASAEKPHSSKANATPNTGRYYLHLSKLHKLTKQTEKWASSEEVRFSGLERQHHSDSTSKLPAELFAYLMQRWQGIEPQGTLTFEDRMNRFVAIGLDATHELQNTHRQKMTIDLEHVAESYSERALSCQFQGEGMLSIGSLVSVRRIDALPQQRLLGVVCKILMSKHKNGLIFELSGIAQQSYSVSYRHSQADSQSELKHALLYGLKSPQGERSFIIVESFMIKDGDILQLFMGQQQFPIILIGRKNIGLGYWQFECRKIEPQQMQQIQKNKGYDFI